MDELDGAGVADTPFDDEDEDVEVEVEVDPFVDEPVVALVPPPLVAGGVDELATALVIGLAAIQPARPVNATPDSTAVTRRARAAG